MTTAATHELPGLEPDNLLAFLALVGLLRALETVRPDWRPRVYWCGTPPVAHITLAKPVSADDIATEVHTALSSLGAAYDFDDRKKADFSVDEFRKLVADAVGIQDPNLASLRLALLSAIGASGPPRPNEKQESFYRTGLIMADGDSQNFFLERVQRLAKLTKDKPAFIENMKKALFRTWQRDASAKDGALRWDYFEARPYAHRARAPNDDTIDPPSTELGADTLAVIGLTAIPVVPKHRGAATIAMGGYGPGATITWPLWSRALGFASVCALLRHPELMKTDPSIVDLERYGVRGLMRAQIVAVARLNVVTRGQPI